MGFEPGGIADKLGNRHEGRWVAKQLLRLLNEDIRSVTVESIGDDVYGVDLWIESKDGRRQAQQCKSRNRSNESWSLGALKSRGILGYLQFQLDRDSSFEFGFVSGIGATLFHDICESARNSNQNSEDFFNHQIEAIGQERREAFRKFCEAVGLDSAQAGDRAKAFGYLHRTHIILFPDDRNSWESLLAESGYLLTGDPEVAIATLIQYAENNFAFRKPIYADELRAHLAALNIHPKRLAHDVRIAPVIDELQRQFDESIRPKLVGGELILREETNRLIEALSQSKDVILHGISGYGKSCVLYEFTKQLRAKNIPYLPVRLDRRDAIGTASQFGKDMGLPDSPANSLVGVAGGRICVLILDQLDAIRWTSAHSSNALDVCKELLGQVRSLRRAGNVIVTVLCCRTFDLENDPEIRHWLSDSPDQRFQEIEVTGLSMPTLERIVGPSINRMNDRQKRVLASPQNLGMWIELQRTGGDLEFKSSLELMRRFWENRRLLLAQARITVEQIGGVLSPLVDYLESNGKISAPKRVTANSPKVLDALCSHGILQVDAGQVTFCHQSYLDYLIADRVLRQMDTGTVTVIDWLGSKERQSLFRREQLRQVLAMLYEESSAGFLTSVIQILSSDGVRFHLKHLVLEVIGQLEYPGDPIRTYCLRLLNDDYWKGHLFETIYVGHTPYVLDLIEKGILQGWLNSADEARVNQALSLLRSVTEKIPDAVAELLEPFVNFGGDWPSRILGVLPWNAVDDSERLFQLRLTLARLGSVAGFVDWRSLGTKQPLRALQLIEAVASTWQIDADNKVTNKRLLSQSSKRLEQWYDDDLKALRDVAANYALVTWDSFMPHIERLTSFEPDGYEPRLEVWRKERLRHHTEIESGIVQLTIVAGREFAANQPEELLRRSRPLETSMSPIVQEILAEAYAHFAPSNANAGIDWLLADTRRFAIGSDIDEPEWMPAVRIIEGLSPHCSDVSFRKLEEDIYNYHSPREMEYRLKVSREGYYGDYWGRAQYFLLPALDSNRVSLSTVKLIAVLRRKFASYSQDRFLRVGKISGGSIGSKLDATLDKISDRAWLQIVSSKKVPEDSGKWVQIDEDHAAESSVRQFSRSLERIAKRFPERFGRLARQFPSDVHPSYVAAIIDAVGRRKPDSEVPEQEKAEWQPASVETIEQVLAKFNRTDARDAATSFCRFMVSRPEENWSDGVIERLIRFATTHSDLEPGKLNVHCDKTADLASVDMLYQNTINCVRGVAAEAIGQLLWNHKELLERLRPAIESLVNDPHPVVRMASINALAPVLNIDKDLAVSWFCKACSEDSRVPASPRAVSFFNYTFPTHSHVLAPLIHSMVASSLDDVAQEGAEEITARWLFQGLFAEELELCRNGLCPLRKGVAQVAALFVHEAIHSQRCRELLIPLLDDPEKEVRAELAGLYGRKSLKDGAFDKELLQPYIKSKAFSDHPSQLVYSLEEISGSLIPFAEIIFTICEVFSTTLQKQSRDHSADTPHMVSKICSLVLRLYEQSQDGGDSGVSQRCLDIWDMLFENKVGITRELTAAIGNA